MGSFYTLRRRNSQNIAGENRSEEGEDSSICWRGHDVIFFWNTRGIYFINYLKKITDAFSEKRNVN